MRAGLLRYSITIQRPTKSKDEYGATITTWVDHITTRARVEYNSGSATLSNDEIWHRYTKTFTIRLYHDVAETDRIKYDGQLYKILSINRDLPSQQITIATELINE